MVFFARKALYDLGKDRNKPVALRIDNISGVAVDDLRQNAERKFKYLHWRLPLCSKPRLRDELNDEVEDFGHPLTLNSQHVVEQVGDLLFQHGRVYNSRTRVFGKELDGILDGTNVTVHQLEAQLEEPTGIGSCQLRRVPTIVAKVQEPLPLTQFSIGRSAVTVGVVRLGGL
ncbi:hypothetical protein HG530_001400 [Fusarium avenaceum]|nr:hypothetical protein HG530_001400 [Fusarium avenaceum]